MTITTMPTICPQQEKRKAEPIRETKHPNDNKNTDQAQIKTPSSASTTSSNQDYCACTQSLNQQWYNKPTHVNESRSEPQVAGRTGSDTICNDPFVTSMNSEAQ